MKNKEVVESFISRNIANSANLISTGNKLISYNTCIAEWYTSSILLINETYYSNTTSRHLNLLKRGLPSYIRCLTRNSIDINTSKIESYFSIKLL